VLCSSLLLIAQFAFWQPIGGVVWNVTNVAVRNAINTAFGFGFGFALVFVAMLLINHFDLFGLRQVALYLALSTRTSNFAHRCSTAAASVVRGLVDRILGYAYDDRRAPSVCGAYLCPLVIQSLELEGEVSYSRYILSQRCRNPNRRAPACRPYQSLWYEGF
jgi:hypothetical protein